MIDESGVKDKVRESYGEIATRVAETGGPASCCPPQQGSCCAPRQATCCTPQQASCCEPGRGDVTKPSHAMHLYPAQDLEELPESVTDAALGCGNPTAIADLQPGEVVLDLGSGGGIDCFLAARRVGPKGRIIGLDMTPEMVTLARRNAREMGLSNVEFRYGEMEEMPVADESVDVIISNCVINLSPDKDQVFSEAHRVLRNGGRLAVSDIVTQGPLPEAVRSSLEAWAGCIAGALDEPVYLEKIRQAGFADVQVTARSTAVVGKGNGAGQGEDEPPAKVASIRVTARKP